VLREDGIKTRVGHQLHWLRYMRIIFIRFWHRSGFFCPLIAVEHISLEHQNKLQRKHFMTGICDFISGDVAGTDVELETR